MSQEQLPSLDELNKYSRKKYQWKEEKHYSNVAPKDDPFTLHWRIESDQGEPVTEWYAIPDHWAVKEVVDTLTQFAKIDTMKTKRRENMK